MNLLLPEFEDQGEAPKRLLIRIKGERTCLAALRVELAKMDVAGDMDGEILTVMAPPAAHADLVLPAVAALLDRVLAQQGRPDGAALSETRMVPASLQPAAETIRLGDRFRVSAAGASRQAGEDTILLTPASSVFGSGLHPSTRLAVRAMDELARQPAGFPARVLDVGTGSGLLAMIAARRGAEMVIGIDSSPEAVEIASQDVARNGLASRVLIAATPLALVAGRFDLILANLTVSVHLRLAGDLQAHLQPGGALIISGLQGRQQDEIADFWNKRGARLVAVYAERGWRALWLQGSISKDERRLNG
jgi:ribosomal protein L11 methylase PrmA